VWKDDTSLACQAGGQKRSVVRGLAETTDEKTGSVIFPMGNCCWRNLVKITKYVNYTTTAWDGIIIDESNDRKAEISPRRRISIRSFVGSFCSRFDQVWGGMVFAVT
jgi:hypothetical protein